MNYRKVATGSGSGLLLTAALCFGSSAWGDTISFTHRDFTLTPVFNSVSAFSFTIEVAGTLATGAYTNPALTSVQYSVLGVLTDATPSGFPGFNLQRTIGGSDFYAQGSSLAFEIAAFANLADGLQISEFQGFVFDGREVNTGRYHTPLLQFSPDGTGSIRNSNNTGGINPSSQQAVNVDFGQEYIVGLGFEPVVPAPATVWLLATGLLGLGGRAWLKRKAA